MKLSLKAQNRPLIIAFSLVLGAFLWWLIEPYEIANLALLNDLYGSLVFVGIATIFTLAVSELIPGKAKLILVYWKLRHPTPGARAFSIIMPQDHRIDIDNLERLHGSFPSDPAEQDRKFYSIYKPLDGDISVDDAHKSYLLFRELTCLSAVFAVAGSVVAGILSGTFFAALVFAGVSALLYLICAIAAQNAGRRMVANVLAVASTQ